MGRIYQVDYDHAFALCTDLERVFNELEGQAMALSGLLQSISANWIPHGAIGKAYGEALTHRARRDLSEGRAAIAALRQALHTLRALEEEQARRMRAARAR